MAPPAGAAAAQGKKGPVVSFGEMLIDFVPTVAGVAITVACLGGFAALVGKLGDDEFGHMLARILNDNGVDASAVVFDACACTALALMTLRGHGEHEFMFYWNPSANMLLTPGELDVDLIRRASVFHYGSINLTQSPATRRTCTP